MEIIPLDPQVITIGFFDSPNNFFPYPIRSLYGIDSDGFTETGYSKILIYKNTIDDIIGYVHSYELFKKPKTIKSILRPVEFVPETMLIQDILNVLTKKRKSIAVVLDEYGNTGGAGVVIAFDKYHRDLKSGDICLMSSFGAGYSIGSIIMEKL